MNVKSLKKRVEKLSIEIGPKEQVGMLVIFSDRHEKIDDLVTQWRYSNPDKRVVRVLSLPFKSDGDVTDIIENKETGRIREPEIKFTSY
jgi:hypothetical protein